MKDQKLCKLCSNPATKTGSHILPFSLIREAISYQGSSKRDKEVSFSFSSRTAPVTYIGRGVLPEQKQEAEDVFPNIESLEKNPTTEDYILCPDCEGRFSAVEGYYSNKIITPLAADVSIFLNTERLFNLPNVNIDLVRLYIYGLYWRCSISSIHSNFKLKPNEQESLRKFLNTYMDSDVNVAVQKLVSCKENLLTLPLMVIFSEELEDPTGSIIHCQPFSSKPYLIMANRYAFLLYMKESHIRSTPVSLYGLDAFYKLPNVINIHRNQLLFTKIYREEHRQVIRNVIDSVIQDYVEKIRRNFSAAYCTIFGRKPDSFRMQGLNALLMPYGGNLNDELVVKLMSDYMTSLPEVKWLMNK